MKKIIKYGLGILLIAMLIYSCSTNNIKTGYIPDSYVQPQSFTMSVNSTTATDSSFEVTYVPKGKGKGYYSVLPDNADAPTSTEIFEGTVKNSLQNDKLNLDGSTPITFTVKKGIYGAHKYKVYAINESTDNIISESVTSISFTTPDTTIPAFLGDESVPAFSTYNSPTETKSVYLKFTEPVYYNTGNVTVTVYHTGKSFTVSGADNFTQVNDVYIGFKLPDVLDEDDVYIISFPANTFKDAAGNPVDELPELSYYWVTNNYSTKFELSKLFDGKSSKDFDYVLIDSIGFSDAGFPIPLKGSYTIKREGDNMDMAKLFNALGETYGDDSYAYKVRFEADSDGNVDGADPKGKIFLVDNPQESLLSAGGDRLFWSASYKENLIGHYDISDGSIEVSLLLGDYYLETSYYGSDTYNYTTPTASTPKANSNIKLSSVTPSKNNMLYIKSIETSGKRLSIDKINKTHIKNTFVKKPLKKITPINNNFTIK